MSMIVHSPYDGHPVKVRDQDLERAIRDNEGRIFYAVRRSDGAGYYGALTRKGSQKDEQRYLDMLEKMDRAREVGAQRSAQQIHDATGKAASRGTLRWLLLIIIMAVIAAAAWMVLKPDNNKPPTGPPPIDTDSPVGSSRRTPAGAGTGGPSHRLRQTNSEDTDKYSRGYVGTASGLRYKILIPGTGDTAVAGKYAEVRYSAWTLGGDQIEATDDEHPVGFVLWSGHAPRGWDEGIAGMRVGETRRLILTPDLMDGPYPGKAELPDSTVRFDIELVGVLPGVRVTTAVQGEGSVARPGDTVTVHYKAYLNREQTAYDSTLDRGGPVEFRIGTGEVIQGWELGVIGMAEGETRTIEIPPYLGYGQQGAAGVIPPNAALRYTVELIRVAGPATRHADVGYRNGN